MKEIVFKIPETRRTDDTIELLKDYTIKAALHCPKHKLAVVIVMEKDDNTITKAEVMCIMGRFDKYTDLFAQANDLTEDLNDLRN